MMVSKPMVVSSPPTAQHRFYAKLPTLRGSISSGILTAPRRQHAIRHHHQARHASGADCRTHAPGGSVRLPVWLDLRFARPLARTLPHAHAHGSEHEENATWHLCYESGDS